MNILNALFTFVSPQFLEKLSDDELSDLLEKFKTIATVNKVGISELPEGLSIEEFMNRLTFIDEEIKRRVTKESAEKVHHIDRGRIDKLIGGLPDEITLNKDFVRFGGSFFESDTDEELIIFIRDGFVDSARDLKLHRLLKSITGKETYFSLCPQGFPDEPLFEGYDLVLRRSPHSNLNIINERDFQKRIYESDKVSFSNLQEKKDALKNGLVDFVLVPGFVCVSGSFVYHNPDKTPNDIDVFVKSFDERSDVVEALGKKIHDISEIKPEFVWESRGPNWTHFPLYDLVLKVSKSKQPQIFQERQNIIAPALKVSNPQFIVKRLEDKKQAILLSSVDRKNKVDQKFILVNEKRGADDPVKAWAVVSFEQEPKTIKSIVDLGRRQLDIDNATIKEFSERRGPFYVLKLRLRKCFKPIPLKKEPTGKRFGSEVNLNKDSIQETIQEAFHLLTTHYLPVPDSGKCPLTHPNKLKNPRGDDMRCYTDSAAEVVKKLKEVVTVSGSHDHPHDFDGLHSHVDLAENSGSHGHVQVAQLTSGLGGGHRHREGDPIEGFHFGFAGDDGSHEHIMARLSENPKLKEWMDGIVDAHYPKHVWLPGHVRTFIQHIGRDDKPFEATRENWVDHFLWMHSSGMHPFRHDKMFIDPETMFIRKWYEFEDGSKRLATKEDFEAEEKWLQENLPFPKGLIGGTGD